MSNVEEKEIELRTWSGGTKTVKAACHGDFGVHRWDESKRGDPWRVTHLPTGLLVASGPWEWPQAIEAMIEIARLRNDWHVIGDDDVTQELAARVSEICARHSGKSTGGPRDFRRGLNGYPAHAVND